MLVALNRQPCLIHKSSVTILEYTKSTVTFYTGVQCYTQSTVTGVQCYLQQCSIQEFSVQYTSSLLLELNRQLCSIQGSSVTRIRQSCLIHESSVTCLYREQSSILISSTQQIDSSTHVPLWFETLAQSTERCGLALKGQERYAIWPRKS